MATFMIESYLSIARTAELEAVTRRLRAAIERRSNRARPMRILRSFYVPEDEIAFLLVEAGSRNEILKLARACRLTVDRIVDVDPAADGGRSVDTARLHE